MCGWGEKREYRYNRPFPFLCFPFYHFSGLRQFLIPQELSRAWGSRKQGPGERAQTGPEGRRSLDQAQQVGVGPRSMKEKEAGDEERVSGAEQRFGATAWTRQQEEESGEAASVRFPEAMGDKE